MSDNSRLHGGAYMLKLCTEEAKWLQQTCRRRFSTTISASDRGDLEKVLDAALGKKADYADLYFEYRRNEGVSLEEGLVKNCSQSTANGVGVRVLADTKTGYAYTDDITIENLELAARTAHYIAQNRPSQAPVPVGAAARRGA